GGGTKPRTWLRAAVTGTARARVDASRASRGRCEPGGRPRYCILPEPPPERPAGFHAARGHEDRDQGPVDEAVGRTSRAGLSATADRGGQPSRPPSPKAAAKLGGTAPSVLRSLQAPQRSKAGAPSWFEATPRHREAGGALFRQVGSKLDMPQLELEIIEFWKAQDIFRRSVDRPAPKGEWVFYEGPPTANGKPGVHHVISRAFKDLFPRFKTMQG